MVGPVLLLGLWLPVWGLAASLRRTVSLPRTVLLAGLFGAGLVLGFHAAVGDTTAWWSRVFEAFLGDGLQAAGAEQAEALAQVAGIMTGFVGAAFTLSVLGSLLLARWWQALLYNPGGFREEFHELRLGRNLGGVSVVLLAVTAALDGPAEALARDMLFVAIVLHLLQGLAVVHALVRRTGSGIGWLAATYVLLLVAMPQTAVTLALAGFADSWADFRARFGTGDDG